MNNAERIERIKQIVNNNAGAGINIIIAQVDPDAIGSALGLSYIIRSMGGKSTIWFSGGVGHPQNRSIINRYDLTKIMRPIEECKFDGAEGYALVDSSLLVDSRMEQELEGDTAPVIIVDHHRNNIDEEDDKLIWVEDVGSACTLIIELIKEMKLEFPDNCEHIPVLLAMGIYSDTKKLVNAGDRDISAYNFIIRGVSPQEFSDLIDYPLPGTYFDNLHTALGNAVISGSRLVAHIGQVTVRQGDDLSTIADILIRRDSITLAVVWGIVNNQLRFSARNDDITTPLDDFLKECFGENSGAKLTPDGHGEGGGLIDLDLGFLKGDDALNEIIALVKKRMETVIFESK